MSDTTPTPFQELTAYLRGQAPLPPPQVLAQALTWPTQWQEIGLLHDRLYDIPMASTLALYGTANVLEHLHDPRLLVSLLPDAPTPPTLGLVLLRAPSLLHPQLFERTTPADWQAVLAWWFRQEKDQTITPSQFLSGLLRVLANAPEAYPNTHKINIPANAIQEALFTVDMVVFPQLYPLLPPSVQRYVINTLIGRLDSTEPVITVLAQWEAIMPGFKDDMKKALPNHAIWLEWLGWYSEPSSPSQVTSDDMVVHAAFGANPDVHNQCLTDPAWHARLLAFFAANPQAKQDWLARVIENNPKPSLLANKINEGLLDDIFPPPTMKTTLGFLLSKSLEDRSGKNMFCKIMHLMNALQWVPDQPELTKILTHERMLAAIVMDHGNEVAKTVEQWKAVHSHQELSQHLPASSGPALPRKM